MEIQTSALRAGILNGSIKVPISVDSALSFKKDLQRLLDKYSILDMQYSHGTVYVAEVKQQQELN